MSGTRRGFLRGLIGATAVAATTPPNKLVEVALQPIQPPQPPSLAFTSEEKNLLRRFIQSVIDSQVDDIHDMGEDEEGSDDKKEYIKGLRKTQSRLDNGKKLAKEDLDTLKDIFEENIDGADHLDDLKDLLADHDLGFQQLESLADKLEVGHHGVTRLRELTEIPTPQFEPPNFSPNTAPLTGEHAIAPPSTPPQVALASPTTDDTTQRALPAPEASSHTGKLNSWLEGGRGAPSWSNERDLSDNEFKELISQPFEEGDGGDSHLVMRDWVESSEGINNRLRGQGDWPKGVDEDIRDLDALFQQHAHTFNQPTTLYRAMPARHLGQGDLTGRHIYDQGLLSTSNSPHRAMSYLEDNLEGNESVALMRIRVPSGTRALLPDRHLNHLGDSPNGQGEVVLPRGSRLKVISHSQANMAPTFGSGRRPIHFLDAELIGHE